MKNYKFYSIITMLVILFTLFTFSCEGLYIDEGDSSDNTSNTTDYTGKFTGSCYFTSYTNPDNSGEVGTDLTIGTNSSGYYLKFNNNPGCEFACAGLDCTTYCDSNGSIDYTSGSWHDVGSISLGSNSGSFTVYYDGVKQHSYSFSCSTKVN